MTGTPLTPHLTSDHLRALESRVAVFENREQTSVVAPFTQEEIGRTPRATPEDVRRAVTRAREAQTGWAATPIKERSRIMIRFHDMLLDHLDEAMDLVQLEAGKSRISAFEEVGDAAITARFYAKAGPNLLRPKRRRVLTPGISAAWELRHPKGVVGVIGPWNYPYINTVPDSVAALYAGNAVVVKPDEKTPYSPLHAAGILEAAGLPEGVFQVVTGSGAEIGTTLIESVDFMMFTGSTRTGRLIAEQSGRRLIGSSMELGGKNAAIVLPDADMERSVRGLVRGVYSNGGQVCVGMERIYVHRSIYEEFLNHFIEQTRALTMSVKFDFSGVVSAMITPEHLEKVQAHVDDAVAKGATLHTGGKPRPDIGPTFFQPTVLTDVTEEMIVCRNETFGPVVSIYPVVSVEEAIAMSNESELGLNFSVWSRDVNAARKIAARLEAGTVTINDAFAATWSAYGAPMGGFKGSGMGRRHGVEGLLKYTEPQTIAVQRLIDAFAPPLGMDYPTFARVIPGALKLLRKIPFYK